MNLQSLGYRSDLIFTNFDGKVEDRGSYLVVRTLTNPNFFWGNLLIFDRPPYNSDVEKWKALFKREFTDPSIYHMTFAWDSPAGEVGDVSRFVEHGFDLQKQVVLATSQVTMPLKFDSALTVRPLTAGHEWDRMIEIQTDSAHGHLPRNEWERFYESQSTRYRKMNQAGLGHWFGGFLDNELVAGLGIFHDGEIGRYQIVSTHPDYRRRGVCGALVYHSAQFALRDMKLKKLVMCADQDYHAARIYESVGFRPLQKEHGVSWWDKNRSQT
jgi:GNAT superfamily N-acetyltransferase